MGAPKSEVNPIETREVSRPPVSVEYTSVGHPPPAAPKGVKSCIFASDWDLGQERQYHAMK